MTSLAQEQVPVFVAKRPVHCYNDDNVKCRNVEDVLRLISKRQEVLFNSLSGDIVGINPQADNHSSSSQAADLNGGNEDWDDDDGDDGGYIGVPS